MDTLIERQQAALKLVEQIIELQPDQGTLFHANRMKDRLSLPMSVVMHNLWPQLSVSAKARRLGITRQTYYGWINGIFRPDEEMAKKLAFITGYDEAAIRGTQD
jgi:transcriptional regulator with XRE-family HTH domain